jgi:hypothetical protein
MKKNVASQVIGCQLVSAAAGAAVTSGTTTVYVTGDGGTQAAGSVGSGACTHEGQGFWTYAPAQAETNYDHVAFTFTNASAIPATVQVYTSFPQTGDSFARIGSTGSGLTSLATQASVDTVGTVVDTILVDTNELQTDWVNGGRLDLILDARSSQASVDTIDDFLDTEIAAILADTNELQTDWANGGRLDLILDAAGSAGDPWSTALPGAYGAGTAGKIVGDNINATISSRATQTSLDAVDDFLDTEIAAIKAKTDNLPADPADASDIAAAFAVTNGKVDAVDDLLDTEVAAIKTVVDAVKAKTDSLTFTVAGQVDANIQAVNDTAIQGTGAVGTDEWRAV